MEQMRCGIVGHACFIDAICINKECTQEQRILCMQCIQQLHTKCNLKYYAKPQFLNALVDLKKDITISLRSRVRREEFHALKNQFLSQLQGLEQKLNILYDEEVDKLNVLKRVDLILNSRLTKESWMDGYDLLTNHIDNYINYDQDQLNEQLFGLRQSLEQIAIVANQSIKMMYLNIISRCNCNWTAVTKSKPFTIKVDRKLYYPESIACSPNGEYFAVDNRNSLELWDLHKGSKVGVLLGHIDVISAIEFSSCGNYLISGSNDMTIRIWDVNQRKQIGENLIGHTDEILSVQYSLNERHILSNSRDQTIRMWDIQSKREIEDERMRHQQPLDSWSPIQFSPQRKHFLVGDTTGIIIIYDFQLKKEFGKPLIGHNGPVYGGKYSADGTLIVSGGYDKTIRIWNCETQTQILNSLVGHVSYTLPVAFSPDMNYIVSGSDDRTLRLWNWKAGKQIGGNIPGHKHEVLCAKFSPDGRYVLSGDYGGNVQILEATF